MAATSDTPSWTGERGGDKHSRTAGDLPPGQSCLGRKVSSTANTPDINT